MKTNTNHDSVNKLDNKTAPVELTLTGSLPLNYKEYRYFHCSMCGQKIDQKQDSIISHSMLCTGY